MLYNKDRLDTAYSNVALIADGAWSINNEYVRANQELLLYECRFKSRMGLQRSVLDTIPESRLAQYGIYYYDEMRESCYTVDQITSMDKQPYSNEEAWMTEEVDRIFRVMNNSNSKLREIEKSCAVLIRQMEEKRSNEKDIAVEKKINLSGGDTHREALLNIHLRQLWETSPSASIPANSMLNVDVPEFYPKVHKPHQEFYLPENIVNEPGGSYHIHHHRHSRMDSFNASLHLYEPWLTYGYPVRAHEFRGLDSLVDGLRLLPTPLTPLLIPTPSPASIHQVQMPARRLYSAVLQNSPPSTVDEDELERQAMEQYRRSEETIAAQYQELERLAEEQYNGSSTESCTISGNGISPRRKESPRCVGRGPMYPNLAAQVFASTLLAIAKLKFTRLGTRFCHLR